MKNIVVLDGKTLGNIDFNRLNQFGSVNYYDVTHKNEVKDRIKDAHIVLTNKVVLDEEILKEAKNLELICETATGFNNIDISYAKSRGIGVTNVAGYSTPTVVQHTFATLLHLYDNIRFYDDYVKAGEYCKSDIFTNLERSFKDICGKTYGIIGLGNIGKGVAKVAEAFGAKVVYYSTSGRNSSNEYERVDFDELLTRADIISIHAPLNDNTNNLMNYDAFKKMKKDAVLINMGRGPIVNEQDLAKAINEDLIGGAALDVFEVEPIKCDNALLQVNNKEKLVLTPHIAWASEEARERLFKDVIENIKAFYNGEIRNRVE
ncbi:MAG: D-2-hydroxyacid dehydrogenase [Clostridium sp.]